MKEKKKNGNNNALMQLIVDAQRYRKCPKCGGSGHVMLPPYYATVMPKAVEYPCETCNGRGRVYVIPDNISIVRESDYN